MIKSMTGYGRSRYEVDGRVYVVEIKSVNHKYNDISIRLPRILNYKEDAISKYFDLVTEYNQAVLRKNTNLKIYTDLVNRFNPDEIIQAVKESIEEYNDSQLARYGDGLIIELNRFAPSYARHVITVEQKAKEYVVDLHKLFENLKEVRTMLRTNYPLPEKYEN